jgi:hypothetical protein
VKLGSGKTFVAPLRRQRLLKSNGHFNYINYAPDMRRTIVAASWCGLHHSLRRRIVRQSSPVFQGGMQKNSRNLGNPGLKNQLLEFEIIERQVFSQSGDGPGGCELSPEKAYLERRALRLNSHPEQNHFSK